MSEQPVAIVTGGASGLGRATAQRLAVEGYAVVVADLNSDGAKQAAQEIGRGSVGVACDVSDAASVEALVSAAVGLGPLRVLVHCAGRGGPVRVVDRDNNPGSLEAYVDTVRVNLIGTYNTLRLVAAQMAKGEIADTGDRGVCVLTALVAAYEGQVGQVAYASSKAGIVGMTLVAARDLAPKAIRVCSIAPGIFDTPMLGRVPEEARARLAGLMPHPRRLGTAQEFADLALAVIRNGMLNGETIRLDGALRMGPR